MLARLYKSYLQSKGISTDSRTVEEDQIFFALSGPNFNGNKFAKTAIAKGAQLAIIDDPAFKETGKYLLVNNVLQTLQDLAKHHRDQFNIPVIGITGSNGKTTTKELTAAVLSQKFIVHYTKGNFNNHIGVPLTLLKMPLETNMAIIEMGANHIGEIKQLCKIAKPNFGLITNISGAHLEGFGSLEGVIKAKSELYDHLLKNDGKAFINCEDSLLQSAVPQSLRKSVYSPGKTIYAQLRLKSSFPFLLLSYEQGTDSVEINSKLYGSYNLINISAALTIAEYFKLSKDQLKKGIESYIPQNNRSQLIKWHERTIIMDAYNANPVSMKASIKHFAESGEGEKILILGEMAELGDSSKSAHKELLNYISNWSWYAVLLVGDHFNQPGNSDYRRFNETEDLSRFLAKFEIPVESSVLLKGSRTTQLEKLLDVLKS
jgi:UDP-N-acetylmuramoyl-tripeptide--D-alanyl-D-alanine ligase